MNQIEAAVAEYSKTILDLQTRIANAAAQICGLMAELEELKKPKEAPKLEAVKDLA